MIVLADLSAMYPSIRKALGITTYKDELGIYPEICNVLNDTRYKYKYLANDLMDKGKEKEGKKYRALEQSLKVFSNTGNYGWLVNQWGKFNDYKAGAEITRWGRRIIKKVNEGIRYYGGTVLRTDTDGTILIVPEKYRGSEDKEKRFVQKVETYLNDWFTKEAETDEELVLEHDDRAQAIILFDDKSYVLHKYDGSKKIKGNTLTGRSNEPFLLDFINDSIDHVLQGNPEKIREEYDYWRFRIENQLMTVDQVKKRQSLNMSLEEYQNKKASDSYSPIAQYEAALQSDHPYIKGDVIETWNEEPEPVIKEYKTVPDKKVIPNASSYEVIRLAKNFNGNIYRDHYLSRLEKGAKKFLVVLGWDKFWEMFPEFSQLKDDKSKMIPIWTLDEFLDRFENYNWRQKDYNKMSEEDQQTFKQYISEGTIDSKFKEKLNL